MQRITGKDLKAIYPFFRAAAVVAQEATCYRAKCGTVIVKGGVIIGRGYNGPALDDEANRTCGKRYDLTVKPKYDKTCCIHAEWRAILGACKQSDDLSGSVLYFMRVDDKGNFTDAGDPYCTTCSRLTLEAGIERFVLWNDNGADVYDASEYNQKSYEFFATD